MCMNLNKHIHAHYKWCWWHRASRHISLSLIYIYAYTYINLSIYFNLYHLYLYLYAHTRVGISIFISISLPIFLRNLLLSRFVVTRLKLSKQFALRSRHSSSSYRIWLSKSWNTLTPAPLYQSDFRIKFGFINISFKCHFPWWQLNQFAGSAQVLLSPGFLEGSSLGNAGFRPEGHPMRGWEAWEGGGHGGNKGLLRGKWDMPPTEARGQVWGPK